MVRRRGRQIAPIHNSTSRHDSIPPRQDIAPLILPGHDIPLAIPPFIVGSK